MDHYNPAGHFKTIEIDPALVAGARRNLSFLP
jgi:hypothetical protein